MRILIVGSDINAYSLAKKFSEDDSENLVFVAPGNKYIKDFATSIDILASDVKELLEFALANEINFTICVDSKAAKNSIADTFKHNNLSVIAPSSEALKFVMTSSIAKKFLYKHKVKTPKFAIFDKENMAVDYVRKSKFPLIVKNDFKDAGIQEKYCYTFSQAKSAISDFFEVPDARIVVENFFPYKKLTQYFLTDGYTAFALGGVEELNISSDKILKQGIEKIYFLTSRISRKMLSKLMTTVVHPLLDDISSNSGGYTGLIGVDLYVAQDNFEVIDFTYFAKKFHLQVILPHIKNNLYDYFYAAALGSLTDDYNAIELDCRTSVALAAPCGLEFPDDVVFAKDAENSVFSVQASNNSAAILEVLDILDEIGVQNSEFVQKSFEEAVFYA